ncbi:MAG: class I SAM-dependent methyltransferase family protein [Thermoprotei archaeon]
MVLGVAVESLRAELVRKTLLKMGLMAPGYRVLREHDTGEVCFPVSAAPPAGVLGGVRLVHMDFPKELTPPAVRVPFDLIGDIALIKKGFRGVRYKAEAAKIARVHRNVKTVYVKVGGLQGSERIPELRCVYGPDRSSTVHRENGLRFQVDVRKAYFNPRLGAERLRVARMVSRGERVLDMFAGVGPYAVTIAKFAGARVDAVDLNPDAVRLLSANISLNGVEDRVTPIHADASLLPETMVYDRVVMNLPFSSLSYVEKALRICSGVAHVYVAEPKNQAFSKVLSAASSAGVGVNLEASEVFEYAPRKFVLRIDVQVRDR